VIKKLKIRVDVCAVIWAIWNTRNDFLFNSRKNLFLARYLYGYQLNLYVVLSSTRGAARGGGFCMQPFEDGS
jgi:hypothetical protein